MSRPQPADGGLFDSRLQLFDALPAPIEDALRESIKRFGVLVPVVKDQHGRTIDGHHRARIADEERIGYRVDVVTVEDDDQAREIARTLNADRRQLTPEKRQEVAAALIEKGHSYRAIAGALGVSHVTVRRDVSAVTDVTASERVVGLDGKSYPRKRPTIIAAKDKREAERALAVAQTAIDLPSKVLDVKRAERIVREAAPLPDLSLLPSLPATADIRHGDFRRVLDLPDESVDLVFTDPPYPAEYLPLWADLALWAQRVLRPGGLLVAYSGQMYLPDVMLSLGSELDYVWCGSLVTPGQHNQVHARHVRSGSKPLLFYAKTPYQPGPWIEDTYISEGRTKDDHDWQQSVGAARFYIERLTAPGAVVVDPFLGSGTTAVAAIELGRSFIGADVDAAAVTTVHRRLSDVAA